MACCGQRRMRVSLSGQATAVENRMIAVPSPQVLFEYTGKTGMTVVGSGTGRSYRFSVPGARVLIDARDVHSLVGVENVRRLR
jgi:hypothetical protein